MNDCVSEGSPVVSIFCFWDALCSWTPSLKASPKASPKASKTSETTPRLKWLRSEIATGCMLAISLNVLATKAHAQSSAELAPELPVGTVRRNLDGSVEVDNNAFDIRSGALENESNIPLPSILPETVEQGVSLPVEVNQQVPNSIEIRTDIPFIEDSLAEATGDNETFSSFDLAPESLAVDVDFSLRYRPGGHAFGEGIEVSVINESGEVVSREAVFVRGDRVTTGPDEQPLPDSAQLTASYGGDETVVLRVLNLRENGAPPTESGIYFAEDGEFIIEDLPNGGDLDFNDGVYDRAPSGEGMAIAVETRGETSIDTQQSRQDLPPELRQEEVVESDVIMQEIEQVVTTREVAREYGSVDYSTTTPSVLPLGHATGASAVTGEALIYDRYTAASEARLGSDGVGLAGQLRPLNANPNAAPTLLTGKVGFNPFVADNEAGVTTTVGITQFLTPTHRPARDMLGNSLSDVLGSALANLLGEQLSAEPALLEPVGLFFDQTLVGFVPEIPAQRVRGEALSAVNGIVNLPEGQVVVQPSEPGQVGLGNAAYDSSVGGLLLDNMDGSMVFVPQWTQRGFSQTPLTLDGQQTARVIYALVPQQAGQDLQLGEQYAVTKGASGHRIANGGFTIISADRQFQNFVQEMPDVYAVEDTLAGRNAQTELFNGLQGVYAQQPGGEPMPTVDVTVASEVDARVGNLLFTETVIPGIEGQAAYRETRLAAGLYVGSALMGGFGNQRDRVVQSQLTETVEFDIVREQRSRNTFMTPLTQVDSITTETIVASETLGEATFDINEGGLLDNVQFNPVETGGQPVLSQQVVNESTRIERGDEALMDSVVLGESIERLPSRVLVADEQLTQEAESYPNFSPLRGEILIGGVLNFGNTPWTAAANTVRAELFARDAVLGRGRGEAGWRAEVIFHPFGEVREAAYRYDSAGNVVPIYQTRSLANENNDPITELLPTATGQTVSVPVNEFVVDDNGERVAQTVGTGEAKGPGAYVRLEDVIDDGESVVIAGGIQFSF
ncbi:MAG: hypothetical protein AAF171_16060 [Cyanobacteria bacterium P01_A01_bin.116]